MSWGAGRREPFEYWGHEASLLPLAAQPLLRWRMRAAERHDWRSWDPGRPWRANLDPALHLAPWALIEGMVRLASERPALIGEVLAAVAELAEAGELVPVRVEGLAPPLYLWRAAQVPRQVDARALLPPFDSLIWERYAAWDRTRALSGFDYRIGIYTRAAEPRAGRQVAGELGAELRLLATWLELDRVLVAGPGNLGPALLGEPFSV